MKKIISILVLIVVVVGISGCIYSSGTKTYSGNGISFNYPADWQISSPATSGTGTSFSVAVYNYNIVISYFYPFINYIPTDVQISSMPSNESTQDVINKAKNFTIRDLTKISNGTLNIDGNTAYQVTCVDNTNGPNKKRYEGISFVKNGKKYSIFLQAPDSDFDKEKPKFDMVLNSLKVE